MQRFHVLSFAVAAYAAAMPALAIEADAFAVGIESVELFTVATGTYAAGDLKFVASYPFFLPAGLSCNGHTQTFVVKGDDAGKRARKLFQTAIQTRQRVSFRITQPASGPCAIVAASLLRP